MKSAGLTEEWLIFDVVKRCRYERIKVSELDLKRHTPPEETFLQRSKQRKLQAAATEGKFPVQSTSTVDEIFVNGADLKADSKVWYKDVPLCDRENQVFLNHDVVELEKRRGRKTVVCLKFVDELDRSDIMAVVLRKLSRTSTIPTMARIELFRIAKDELNFDFETISHLFVSKHKGRKSVVEIVNEYRAAKVYEELGAYKPKIGGRCLADTPEAFSKVKFMMGRTEIREDMERSRERREHFVNIAVSTTLLREKRFQDLVPKMLRHEETKKLLFEGNYAQAKATLNKLFPEHNKQTYPYLDLVAANRKLESPDTLRMAGSQIESNPDSNPLLAVLLDIVEKVSAVSPEARGQIHAATRAATKVSRVSR